MEWLNGVFRKHLNNLESDLLETGQFTFSPKPRPSFFSVMPLTDRLGGGGGGWIDSRGSSASSRSRQLGSTPMEKDEMENSTPQSSVMSSVVIVKKDKIVRASAGGPGESNKNSYLE